MKAGAQRLSDRTTCARLGGSLALPVALLVLLLSFVAIPSRAGDRPVVVTDTTLIIGNNTTGPFWLSGYFIIRQSESVRDQNDRLFQPDEYTLDPNRARITFAEPLAPSESLRVVFNRLNWAIPAEWTLNLRNPTGSGRDALITPASATTSIAILDPPRTSANKPASSLAESITWRGFKSFSISSSTGRGTEWSQGMELSVDGELTPGLQLRAAVSDRFSGALAQSRSPGVARVGDLDRFFIEATSDQFFGRLGELSLQNQTGGTQTRNLSGAQVRWNNTRHGVGGFVGRAAGTIVRRRVPVQPQIAGPYRLNGDALGPASVIPGTIVLYFDGRRLTEGPNGDYTFDPSDGSITFNTASAPTARTVVVAEFEQALTTYRRTLAGADWSWTGSASRSSLLLQWEGDDPGHLLIGSLSDAQRAALAANPDGAVAVSAAEYRGSRDGDYKLAVVEGDSIFTYAGKGNGDWRVNFEYVGRGEGRYTHLAEAAYEYVGAGNGSYEPTVTLNAPASNLAVRESFKLDAGPAGQFEGQWLGHIDDPNRFAKSSSQFTSEHDVAWSIGGNPSAPTGDDRLRLAWSHHAPANGRALVADDYARFSNDWNLRAAYFDSSRNEYGIGIATSDTRPMRLSVQSGVLAFDRIQAWRVTADLHTDLTEHLTHEAQWSENVAGHDRLAPSSEDRMRETSSRVAYATKLATFDAGWREQRQQNDQHIYAPTPEFFSERYAGIERNGIRAEYRWDQTRDSSITLPVRTREAALVMPLQYRTISHGRLTVARGERAVGDGSFSPYYRGQLDGQWQPRANVSVTADMRLDYARSAVEREVYLPTRPGEGQYRLERGEYIPDTHGDYRRVIASSDELGNSAYEGRQRLIFNWRPRIGGWRWNLESRRERIGRYDPIEFSPTTWLAPWTNVGWAALDGSRSERHDYRRLTAYPNNKSELTGDWSSDVTVFGLSSERNRRDRAGLTARHQVSSMWYVQLGGDYEQRSRTGGVTASIDNVAITWRSTLGGTPRAGVKWSLEGRRRIDREKTRDTRVRLLGLRARVQLSHGPLQLLIDNDAAWVRPDGAALLSPLLAEGRPEGFSVTEFSELRWQLPGKFTLKSRLIGDLRADARDRWRWEVETTASF